MVRSGRCDHGPSGRFAAVGRVVPAHIVGMDVATGACRRFLSRRGIVVLDSSAGRAFGDVSGRGSGGADLFDNGIDVGIDGAVVGDARA